MDWQRRVPVAAANNCHHSILMSGLGVFSAEGNPAGCRNNPQNSLLLVGRAGAELYKATALALNSRKAKLVEITRFRVVGSKALGAGKSAVPLVDFLCGNMRSAFTIAQATGTPPRNC